MNKSGYSYQRGQLVLNKWPDRK